MKRRTLLFALISLQAIVYAGPHGPSTSRSRAGGPLDPRRRDDQEGTNEQEAQEKTEEGQEQGKDKPTTENEGKSND